MSPSKRIHPARFPAVVLAASLGLVFALGGCGSDDEPAPRAPSASTPSTTPSAGTPSTGTPTPTPEPTPSGPERTVPGTQLTLGQRAIVDWTPQGRVEATASLKVTTLQRGTWDLFRGWKRTKELRAHTPYFVTVVVKNIGPSGLGGVPVPLRLVDNQDRLIEASTFADTFPRCPSTSLPKKFRPGKSVTSCLVFLVPAGSQPTAVVHRPDLSVEAISWTGKVAPATPRKKPGKKPGAKSGEKSGEGKDR